MKHMNTMNLRFHEREDRKVTSGLEPYFLNIGCGHAWIYRGAPGDDEKMEEYLEARYSDWWREYPLVRISELVTDDQEVTCLYCLSGETPWALV